MPDATQQLRREAARRDVREYLADRPAVALREKQIRRGLNAGDEHDYTDEEVDSALAFLRGAGQVRELPDGLGATPYFQITSEGTIAHERDPLA